MYRTQLIQRTGEAPDFAASGEIGITGDLNDYFIRRAVEWTLTGVWEGGKLDGRLDLADAAVAVWRGTEFVGVYTMDAEEVCPEWQNLKRVEETPEAE